MASKVECPACGRETSWLQRQNRFRYHLWKLGKGMCPTTMDEETLKMQREVWGLPDEWPRREGYVGSLEEWFSAMRKKGKQL